MSAKRRQSMASIQSLNAQVEELRRARELGNPIVGPVSREAEEELARQDEEDERKDLAKNLTVTSKIIQLGNRALRGTRTSGRALTKGMTALPTPGSVAFPLAILLILVVVLLPVGGHTRLMWLWLAATGNATIAGASPSIIPQTIQSSVTGTGQTSSTNNPNTSGINPSATGSFGHKGFGSTNVHQSSNGPPNTSANTNPHALGIGQSQRKQIQSGQSGIGIPRSGIADTLTKELPIHTQPTHATTISHTAHIVNKSGYE